MNMFTLTQALRSVFVNPKLTDDSNNKSGPSFNDLDRMEDFWEVRKQDESFFFFLMSFFSIVYDKYRSVRFLFGTVVQQRERQ